MSLSSSAQIEAGLTKKKSRLKKTWPWIGVAVLVAGGAVALLTIHKPGKSSFAGGTVRYISVQRGNVAEQVSMSGTLTPMSEATLTGSSSKIIAVYVKPGDKVQKGQVIAKLDSSSYQLQLASANAALSQAQAKLAQAQEPVTTIGSKGSSQTQSPDPNVIAQAQAGVEQAQAQVDSIQADINACTITSPIAGTVLQIADPNQVNVGTSTTASGQNAQSGQASNNTIATIADLSSNDFEVQANVAQSEISSIHDGQTATISLSAGSSQTLTGKVTSIGYLPQTQGGVTTYPVTISVNPASGISLLPGETAAVTVNVKQAQNVLTVPAMAITQRRGTTGVYVPAQGSTSSNGLKGLQFQPVTVGIDGGNTVQVTSGLTEGEQIAIVIPNYNTSQSGSGSASGRQGMGLGAFGGLSGAGYGGSFGGSYGGSGRSGGSFGGGYGGNGGNRGGQ